MHKHIYLLTILFTLLSPTLTKPTLYHPHYDSRCPQDPFDTKFFYNSHKITHNTTFSPPNDSPSTTETLLSPSKEPVTIEPQAIPPQPSENFAKKLVNGIGGFFKRIPDTITQGAKHVEEKVKDVTRTLADSTTAAGNKATGFIKTNVANGVNTIKEKTMDISNTVSEKAQSGWNTIKEAPQAVLNTVSSIGEKAKEAPKKVFSETVELGEKVWDFSRKVTNSVKEAGNKAKEFIVGGVTGSVNIVREKTENIPNKVAEKAKQGWEKVKEMPKAVANTMSSVGEKAKSVVKDNIVDHARNIGGKIHNTVSEGTYNLFEGLKKIPSKAAAGVNSAKEKCKDLIPQGASQGLKSFTSGIKDFFTSLPQKASGLTDKLGIVKGYLGEKKDKLMGIFRENKEKIVSKAKEGVKSVIGGTTGMFSLMWDGFGWAFSSVRDTLVKILILAVAILGLYIFIQIRPFLIFILDILSLCKCRNRKSEQPARAAVVEPRSEVTVNKKKKEKSIVSVKEPVKLNKEDFEMECVSLKADKIVNDESSNFLRFHLHYEIKHFPTIDGDVFLKFTTLCSGTVKQSAVFTVPAEEFVRKSVWNGCSFQDPLSKYTEDANVRLCVDFKSDFGQYFSICSKNFSIMLV